MCLTNFNVNNFSCYQDNDALVIFSAFSYYCNNDYNNGDYVIKINDYNVTIYYTSRSKAGTMVMTIKMAS